MRKLVLSTATAIALFAGPQAVEASGDYACEVRWSLASPSLDCASSAVLSPGNDTRVNLFLLMRERAGLTSPGGRAYANPDYYATGFGHVFLDWRTLEDSYFPQPEGATDDPYGGSRCDTMPLAIDAFKNALSVAKSLSDEDRTALGDARSGLSGGCETDDGERRWPSGIGSKIGQDFLSYLVGADAFYAGRLDEARTAFNMLARSGDPWVAETATYMIARNELVASQQPALDEWGDFAGSGKTDKEAARRGQLALEAYLKAYPDGRYAVSARGLQRRALWLLGESEALARTYLAMLDGLDSSDPAIPLLVREVDNKLGYARGSVGEVDVPLMLAAADLQRMRGEGELYEGSKPITAQEIADQAPIFAKSPGLYSFVQANHAFYVVQDYRRVLELLPDDARQPGYTPLAFSRQVLRGLALDALGDRNATGFWLELAGGPKDLYQRPAVELALAMSWERSGALAKVFGAQSPVRESEIRLILLQYSASEAILRSQASARDRPVRERDAALFMLLYKQLATGRYKGFLGDLPLVAKDAAKDGQLGDWLDPEGGSAPVGLFTKGAWAEDYRCPALASTITSLSRNARDPGALLCLGEFYRLNGFDWFAEGLVRPDKDELGGVANDFGGTIETRHALYQKVISDRAASPHDKAYALYRAVRCYAPGGSNSCGGDDVPLAQRKAWFQRLKREFPKSRWAGDLEYYW